MLFLKPCTHGPNMMFLLIEHTRGAGFGEQIHHTASMAMKLTQDRHLRVRLALAACLCRHISKPALS